MAGVDKLDKKLVKESILKRNKDEPWRVANFTKTLYPVIE
jgi:hypothetical protein